LFKKKKNIENYKENGMEWMEKRAEKLVVFDFSSSSVCFTTKHHRYECTDGPVVRAFCSVCYNCLSVKEKERASERAKLQKKNKHDNRDELKMHLIMIIEKEMLRTQFDN
jgi:hypothetical protein